MVGIRSFGFAVAIAAYAVAQSTEPIATCTNSSYAWTYNSLGQSPCVMTAWLGGVCNAGVFNVPPLESGLVYLGPTAGSANGCRCSSVFYSLISACALCQSEQYLRWTPYQENCTTAYSTVFPYDIPNSTKIPHWAYLDVVPSDQFLPSAALAAVDDPESTSVPTSTSASSSQSSTSSTSATPSSSPISSSGSSNTGAIAGGVVGGIAGLAAIAALVFWWTRRNRARPASSLGDHMSGPMSESAVSPTAISFNQTTPFGTAQSPKLYDPADPSTFPSSPAVSTTYTSQDYPNPNQQHPGTLYHSINQGPHYTGAPEL